MKLRKELEILFAVKVMLLLSAGGLGAQSPAPVCKPTIAPRGGGGPQVADSAFAPDLGPPAFPAGRGPVVLLDEGHHNFQTLAGRYAPFARLLSRDGFVVRPLAAPLDSTALLPARVLVIANALSESAARAGWRLPNPPAFSAQEIAAVSRWVAAGGSLLLIADHMPFPGAAETLAAAFGVVMTDGFATDGACAEDEFAFRRVDGGLAGHPVTDGRSRAERVDSVRTFTGQAFRLTVPGTGLLRLPRDSRVLLPAVAWQFSDSTPSISAEGMFQGAVLRHGKGRVAVFGEAAMFSAQVSGAARRPMGMNAPRAAQNPRFLLNLMHWLAGTLR